MTDDIEPTDEPADGSTRRTVLKTAAATGAVASGLGAMTGSAAAQSGTNLLKNIDVTGTLLDGDTEAGTFDGKLSITDLAVEDGELLTSGTLKGTATTADGTTQQINQTFEDVTTSLTPGGSSGECDILNLDLGPIFLDLLGLQVDLDEVNLDITAVRGPGNLLGNLLCAVANLLNQ